MEGKPTSNETDEIEIDALRKENARLTWLVGLREKELAEMHKHCKRDQEDAAKCYRDLIKDLNARITDLEDKLRRVSEIFAE